ncbi:MAG: hypothetical protein QXS02_02990, partial [Candidatus Thermoplasmatota archaeon]
ATVNVDRNLTIHVYCTWQRTIRLIFNDQHGNGIRNIKAILLNKDKIPITRNTSNDDGVLTLTAPYNPDDVYHVESYYRDFLVYNKTMINTMIQLSYRIKIGLYNLTVEVRDKLGLPPGVDINPVITHNVFSNTTPIPGVRFKKGFYYFNDIPSGEYTIQLPYSGDTKRMIMKVPDDGESILLCFDATCKLTIIPFDTHGNNMKGDLFTVSFYRDNAKVYEYKGEDLTCDLSPGLYIVKLYKSNKLIGSANVKLYNDQSVKIVTTLQSPLPYVLMIIASIVIIALAVLALSKNISVYGLIKGLVITLLLLSLVQPWWSLTGENKSSQVGYNSNLYMQPPVMIESKSVSNVVDYNIAVLPEIFTSLLSKLTLLIYIICIIILISIILKRLRRRTHVLFTIIGLIMIAILLIIFSYGLNKLTEISVGSMNGNGNLRFVINESDIDLPASWGLSTGFYMITAACILMAIVSTADIHHLIKNKRR